MLTVFSLFGSDEKEVMAIFAVFAVSLFVMAFSLVLKDTW